MFLSFQIPIILYTFVKSKYIVVHKTPDIQHELEVMTVNEQKALKLPSKPFQNTSIKWHELGMQFVEIVTFFCVQALIQKRMKDTAHMTGQEAVIC